MTILKFLALFKLHFKHKKKFFKCQYCPRLKPTVTLLIQLNLIKFAKLRGNIITVHFNNVMLKSHFSDVKIVYNRNFFQKLSLETLRLLNLQSLSTLTILSTNKGLLPLSEALKLKVGGFIFLKFV